MIPKFEMQEMDVVSWLKKATCMSLFLVALWASWNLGVGFRNQPMARGCSLKQQAEGGLHLAIVRCTMAEKDRSQFVANRSRTENKLDRWQDTAFDLHIIYPSEIMVEKQKDKRPSQRVGKARGIIEMASRRKLALFEELFAGGEFWDGGTVSHVCLSG